MQSFWRLLGYIRSYKGLVGLNIVSNILTAVFTALSIPLFIPFLQILFGQEELVQQKPEWALNVDQITAYFKYHLSQVILQEGKAKALLYVCGALLSVFFFKNLFHYLSLFFMAPVRNGIIRDLRQQLFEKMLSLHLGYFSEERKGDLMSRITADVQEVEWSILNVLEAVFREPLIIVSSLAIMLLISPSLTFFVFLLVILTAVVIGLIGRTLRKSSHLVQEKLGVLVSLIEEGLGGLRIIKAFHAEAYQQRKFSRENNEYRRILTQLLWRRDLASPLSEFLGIGAVAVLLWYGARQVFSGQLEAATFLTFIYAFYNVIQPAKQFTRALYNIEKGIAAMLRVEKVLDAENRILSPPRPRHIDRFERSIEYRNVSFAYNPEEGNVLDSIDLILPKGKMIALVGASGAGKSTLVDLLPRFYDVQQGEIFIDDVDIREFSLQSLRSLMGIVSQEAILFNDTIYNNIVFGLEQVTGEDVIRAARIANAHDFIQMTEQGYQTNIGDRGSKLSGGQRQRLTIARAILKDPPILILDEATSSLDSESEKLVQEALIHLMKDRTSIVIAHRLSTIQHADEIIVMKQGRIIERGTHDELILRQGEYRKLVELQAF